MKLQAKFTTSIILLVLALVSMSFFFIHQNLNDEFQRFMIEKRQEATLTVTRGQNGQGLQVQLQPGVELPEPPGPNHIQINPDSPEARFLNAARYSLIAVGLIGVLLAIIIGYFLSRFLLRRVSQLRSAMNEYRHKGVSLKVSHGGEDEIDDLSDSYNHLIDKLGEQENIRKEFFTDMSHELRTPLTSVKGYLEGLADGVFEPKKEVFEKALGETDRMIHLVKELTTLAKMEAGDIPLKKTEVDLKTLTDEVVEDFGPKLEEKKMIVKVTGEAKVNADPHKFRQVINNLLDNAVSHGDPGHEIHIEIGKEKESHFWVIKNKATNLDHKHLEYIFERFYRADKSRKYDEKEPHLGIGLNIVRKIVEAHRGVVTAKMEGGQAVFRVEIPGV